MKATYALRSGDTTYRGIPAQILGEELLNIRNENDGKLTTQAIVESARRKSSPLHPGFIWDDSEAAEAYRKVEARHMVREVRTVYAGSDLTEPTFVHVTIDSDDGPAERYYQVSEIAVEQEDEWAIVLRNAKGAIVSAAAGMQELKRIEERAQQKKSGAGKQLRLPAIKTAIGALDKAGRAAARIQ